MQIGKRRYQVFCKAIGQELLLGFAGKIVEEQDGDGGQFGRRAAAAEASV